MARDQGRRPTPRSRAKRPGPSRQSSPARTTRGSAPSAPRQRVKASSPGGRESVPRARASKGAAPKLAVPKTAASKAASPKTAAPKAASPKAAAVLSGAASSAGALASGLAARLGKGRGAAASPREQRARHQRGQVLRLVAIAGAGVLALGLVALIALFVLRDAPVFEITSVEVEPTQHVTVDDVSSLVQVPAGSTLLNVDTAALEESIKREPWVGSVSFERVFPNTLRITITEQEPDMLVVMSSGSVGWYLGTAGTWIEPVRIEAAEGQSTDDAALALAQSEGCLLVTDVPATVDPEAGSPATDEVLDAIAQFREGFSSDFSAQIVRFSAPSADSVSCTLESGVEVSLGSPTDIAEKEAIVSGYLEQNQGSLVSINVRVVSSPAYRVIDSENAQQGDGVTTGAGQVDEGAEGESAQQGDGGSSAE